MTARQLEYLRFISDYIAAHGWSPSRQDIADAMAQDGKTGHTNNAAEMVSKLERDGYLRVGPGPRQIALTEKATLELSNVDGSAI